MITDHQKTPPPVEVTWEQWYPLTNDAILHDGQVEIGARVIFKSVDATEQQIVFRRGNREAIVPCVHVAVYAGSLESLPPEVDLARSTERHPIQLAPEEHFFALKSYVGGIAEVGLGTMFAAARDAGNLPVGFNDFMQKQVLEALYQVAPAATFDFCMFILGETSNGGDLCSSVGYFPLMKKILVRNEHAPPEILARLAEDKDVMVRRDLAQHMHTPPEILGILAQDKDVDIRRAVALHLRASPEIHWQLAQDADVDVRRAVALHKLTPGEVLARLACDDDVYIRRIVAHNSNTPPEVLAHLVQDTNALVRRDLVFNTNLSMESLAQLSTDHFADVREHVAMNRNTPLAILARLARDEDVSVRCQVAGHSNTSLEILEQLACDLDHHVQVIATTNLHKRKSPRKILK